MCCKEKVETNGHFLGLSESTRSLGCFKNKFSALCRKIKAPLQVLEVEAKAYKVAMLLARHLGLPDELLEGDSLTISNALKGISVPPTSVAAIVEGIHVLGSEIDVVNFSHVRRSANKPAHIRAIQALGFVNDVIWIEEIPCCIQQALI